MAIYTSPVEGTNGTAVSVSNTGAATNFAGISSATLVLFSNTQAAHGSTSMICSSGSQTIWWTPAGSVTAILTRGYVYIPSTFSVDTTVTTIYHTTGTGKAAQIAFVAVSAGNYRARLSTQGSGSLVTRATDTVNVATGSWVRYELLVTSGTTASNGTARAAIYPADSTTASWDSGLITGIDTAGTVGALSMGRYNLSTTFYTDDVAYKDGVDAVWGAYPNANTPPTVDAGVDQIKSVSSTCSLSATIVDPDNTPTILWSFDYFSTSSAPTLTGATSALCSFPVGSADGHMFTLRCTVNDGVNPAVYDTMNVYVPAAGDVSIIKGAGTGGAWTTFGSPASAGVGLSDGLSTTGIESPDITASEVYYDVHLAPMTQRTSLRIAISDTLLTAAGSTTDKVRIMCGATQITERTTASLKKVSDNSTSDVTTSAQNLYLDLTSPEVAAITALGTFAWCDLRVRPVAVQ